MLESNSLGLMTSFDSLMDLDLFETDRPMMTLNNEIDRLERMNFSSCSASPVHSISTASSESGDLTLNGIYKFVSTEDPVLTEVVIDDDVYKDFTFPNFSHSPIPKQSYNDNYSEFSNFADLSERSDSDSLSNSWSRSISKESLETLEALTQIISCKMGLREQLEVIRIINPTAVITSTEKEFTIDLKYLDDMKLQRIKDYVQSQTLNRSSTERSSNNNNNNNNNRNKFKNSSSKSNLNTHCNSNSILGKTKSTKSKERRNQMKAWKNRQRKEYKQLMKERKSGLFLQEEVLSLSRHSQNDDDDVDILE